MTTMEQRGTAMLIIRHACASDDLSTVYTEAEAAMLWNREQMLVAVEGAKVVGIVLFVDGGHPLLWLENIRVHPKYRLSGIGTQLLEALVEEARRRGCLVITGAATGEAYLAFLMRHGVTINPTPCYIAMMGVAQHA